MDIVDVYVKKIDEFILKYKDENKISSIQIYLKNNAKIIYGIPMKRLKALFSKYVDEFNSIDNNDVYNIINNLFLSFAFEKQVIACMLLEKYINKLHINMADLFKNYVEQNIIINWAVADQTALNILSKLNNLSFTYDYASHENYLLRRSAVVTFAEKNMTDDDCNMLINIIKLLLNEKEEYVLRASGWAIRNIYNHNEKIYFDFLNDYAHKLPRIMLRNAIEMLEEDIHFKRKKRWFKVISILLSTDIIILIYMLALSLRRTAQTQVFCYFTYPQQDFLFLPDLVRKIPPRKKRSPKCINTHYFCSTSLRV